MDGPAAMLSISQNQLDQFGHDMQRRLAPALAAHARRHFPDLVGHLSDEQLDAYALTVAEDAAACGLRARREHFMAMNIALLRRTDRGRPPATPGTAIAETADRLGLPVGICAEKDENARWWMLRILYAEAVEAEAKRHAL